MKTEITNITGMALYVDGGSLLPGQSKVVELTEEIQTRVNNGFFKINETKTETVSVIEPEKVTEEVKEEDKLSEPVEEEKEQAKEVGVMVEPKKPNSNKKSNKN